MRYGEQQGPPGAAGRARSTIRKRGLGALLLAWLEKCAVTAGLERIQVEARADNPLRSRSTRDQGYRQQGIVPGYYRGMVDAVQVRKARFLRARPIG